MALWPPPLLLILLLLLLLIPSGNATFSPVFRRFLRQNYGVAVDKELSREDLGGGGSFGGGNHQARKPTKVVPLHPYVIILHSRRPVILVHGIANNAGNFRSVQHYFLKNGYADEEVYGTTYGDAGKTNLVLVSMACHYIKVIRMIIQAVSTYTGGKVNVIAYSMGSPVARKAIMGGVCVDTKENIGPPLTNLVRTFVGVAGANWGSFLCVIPLGCCNLVNGMACGSLFLNDINSKQRYEGESIFTIHSTGDEWVGHRACGKIASAIQRENGTFLKNGLSHQDVILNTASLQYDLVTKGKS